MTQATSQIENIRAKVSDAINKYGNTVVLVSRGTVSRDAWGHADLSATSSTTTIGVTDNNIIASMKLGSMGRVQDGESIILLKGTETITESYTLTTGGETYNIVSLQPLKAADIVVAYEVIVGRI